MATLLRPLPARGPPGSLGRTGSQADAGRTTVELMFSWGDEDPGLVAVRLFRSPHRFPLEATLMRFAINGIRCVVTNRVRRCPPVADHRPSWRVDLNIHRHGNTAYPTPGDALDASLFFYPPLVAHARE
jgi:hypothetical protein